MSEAGKVNINLVSESLLRKIIGNLGLEGEQRDIVVDSIMDWRDPDDSTRSSFLLGEKLASFPKEL
jgi:general secretion pathway protein K